MQLFPATNSDNIDDAPEIVYPSKYTRRDQFMFIPPKEIIIGSKELLMEQHSYSILTLNWWFQCININCR